jgi:quercetin dioxygenase-like cupin family protein
MLSPVSGNGKRDGSVSSIRSAFVVVPCDPVQPTLEFLVERLGFRLDRITPADDPRLAELSGHGLRLQLRRDAAVPPGTLVLACADRLGDRPHDEGPIEAPNGMRIEFAEADPSIVIPPGRQQLVVTRQRDSTWVQGRAGMHYRDLIPGRLGGRFIASHIRIASGGPVPDHVHHHALRFQLIYCHRGWVRLVYEDQGPPFVLGAGDAVLQPPGIRHRVLESAAGLEVVEVACPAEHDTFVDHALELPTPEELPERGFGGQRFVWHRAEDARFGPWRFAGFECRDTGVAAATDGLAAACVVRSTGAPVDAATLRHDGELLFFYVLAGGLAMTGLGRTEPDLSAGDALALPAGEEFTLGDVTADLELLEVRLPA